MQASRTPDARDSANRPHPGCARHWSLGRAWQVLFVIVVFTLQMLLSYLWLSWFRYGPVEWPWRWFTYLRRPQMRVVDAGFDGISCRPSGMGD
ncbi:MAG: DUF418 domain-containing protein [Luteimonas sp.]